MDISFSTTEGRFNCRVAGLIIHEGRLLVMKDPRTTYYYLPGGRIALNETSEEALKREMQEELGIAITIERLLWVNENYFYEDYFKEHYHEICFYYLVCMEDLEILQKGASFTREEEGFFYLNFLWQPVTKLSEIVLKPDFLQSKAKELAPYIEHFVEGAHKRKNIS
jgi:8-oxo-dGTP pyrophosphatase MutT (NUDIX family)